MLTVLYCGIEQLGKWMELGFSTLGWEVKISKEKGLE